MSSKWIPPSLLVPDYHTRVICAACNKPVEQYSLSQEFSFPSNYIKLTCECHGERLEH